MKVAYLVSRFPKITETFILNELFAVEKQDIQVELYPLQREPIPAGKASVMHPGAEEWVKRAHYTPWISIPVLWSNLVIFLLKPLTYLRTLARMLWSTRGSRRFFAGALVFFPKTVHIARLMQRAGVRHIHAHFASHPAAAAFVIHRLTGIPYSFTAHGSDIHRDQHMLKEKTAEAAFVVPISRFNRMVILQASEGEFAEKMHIVHCGVDTRRFQQPVERAGERQDGLQIACVGTLHEVKGQTFLLEACRLLKEKSIPFTCHILGDGPDQPALAQQAASTGLSDQVRFHGRLDQQAVLRQLQQSDVLVAPSVPSRDGRREGIPVVLMEAMAVGLPVVSSRISGIPELVDDGASGLLTEPGDAAAIARAIEGLAADPTGRRRLGDCGRQKVIEAFDLDHNAAILAGLFKKYGGNS